MKLVGRNCLGENTQAQVFSCQSQTGLEFRAVQLVG